MLRFAGIAPHPPIIIPEIGRGDLDRVKQTVTGMQEFSRRLREAKPELLVMITPHGPALRDGVTALGEPELTGDFGRFGAPQVRLAMRTDPGLLGLLEKETAGSAARTIVLGLPDRRSGTVPPLDHGAMVPLYYLREAGLDLPGLHLTFGYLSPADLFEYGRALRRAVDARGVPAALVASGDLSHRLQPGAPAGFSPRAADFDRLLVELLRERKVQEILSLDPVLVEEAGECGLRSIIIVLGALQGEPFTAEVLSYEGPFGVGYLVAELRPGSADATGHSHTAETDLSVEAAEMETAVLEGVGAAGRVRDCAPAGESRPANESGRPGMAGNGAAEPAFPGDPVQLARASLEHYLKHGRPLKPPQPPPQHLAGRAGAFVSLKKGDALRGCIGTVEPARRNLAEEIIANAVSAAVRDPRFAPVRPEELEELSISVDVLTPMERVESTAELDPKIYGVLVRSGAHSGLLLPDLEGIDTVEEQVEIASRKAGLRPGDPVELYRFRVIRYM